MEKKEEQSRMQIAKWGVSIEWISEIFFLPEDELLLFSYDWKMCLCFVRISGALCEMQYTEKEK